MTKKARVQGSKKLPESFGVRVLEWARARRRRAPRPRGWQNAGMRTNKELARQQAQAVDILRSGRAVSVTRRWPA